MIEENRCPLCRAEKTELRELWKLAACAALSNGRLSAEQAADEADLLLAEFSKRCEAARMMRRDSFPSGDRGVTAWDPAAVTATVVDTRLPRPLYVHKEPVAGGWKDASTERLAIIEENECPGYNTLATSRFRRCFNEIKRLQLLVNQIGLEPDPAAGGPYGGL